MSVNSWTKCKQYERLYGITECVGIFYITVSHCVLILWGCVYPDGRVPLPALRWLLVLRFLRFWLIGFVLLLWHFHHSVLWLFQLSPLLSWTLPSPAHLQDGRPYKNRKGHCNLLSTDLIVTLFQQRKCIVLTPPSSWFPQFLFLHNMRHPQWATSFWEDRRHRHLTPKHRYTKEFVFHRWNKGAGKSWGIT